MGATALIARFDAAVGSRIEKSICAHHGRRLRRRGQGLAFDPPAGGWAETGAFAPRAGSRVEFLVDGAEVLPRMVADIRAAESHVEVAGWFFTPSFRMGEGGPPLRELLADAAQRVDVRVLAWAGAPLPIFHPDRGEVRELRDELTRGTRIEMHLDAKERPMHCHHEKLVIVDDRVAYVGGIDLTDLAGNRLDTSAHEPRDEIGWHDACLRLEGPIVADVAAHYRLRWPRPLPAPQPQQPRCGRLRGATRADRAGEGLRRAAEGRVHDPRELCARAARGRAAHLSREPVPVVAGVDRGARGQAAQSPARGLPRRRRAARRSRTTARTTHAGSSGC